MILWIDWDIPGSIIQSVRGFFCPDVDPLNGKRRSTMGNVELSLIKKTIWSVRDWDGFQAICRQWLKRIGAGTEASRNKIG